ncbi:MAG: hypothetical protein Q9M97_09105 [Candidatus Gracilibacteria bacterium]|nr:hypothetical protein [Candidatus Gracilibacteria bacterium]
MNNKLNIVSKITFKFGNSKKILGIQLADMISYKLGKKYFFNEDLDDIILENLFNIDISKNFKL